ncbi:MAG: hypothetical protein ACK50J_11845, partial [Planctomyces sp.]
CLGVQWHPESSTASALDLQIFEAFVEASEVWMQRRNETPAGSQDAAEMEVRDILPMTSALQKAA